MGNSDLPSKECANCRSRRIKCDLSRPSCSQCSRTRRVCPGYADQLGLRFVDETAQVAFKVQGLRRKPSNGFRTKQVIHAATPLLSLTTDVPGDYHERQMFYFFKSRTLQDVLGQQDAYLWDRLFLQLSHLEPVVRHAVVAVAALHKSLDFEEENNSVVKTERDQRMHAFSMQHYLKAVRLLTTRNLAATLSPDIMVTVCILFFCYEEFRGDFAASMVHLKGGIELFRQWKQSSSGNGKFGNVNKSVSVVLDRLDSILTRLDVQEATFLDHDPKMKLLHSCYEQHQPLIPPQFESLLEARKSLDKLMKWMFSRLESTAVTAQLTVQTEIELMLKTWLRALKPYFADEKSIPGHSDLPAIYILRIYYLVCSIIYRVFYSADELVFDQYTEKFRIVVDLARKILMGNDSKSSQYMLAFSFDFGITPPLCFTADRCRDPSIRRQAISLLNFTRRRQGGFGSSGLCAACEEHIMQVEEFGLGHVQSCDDVPGNNRVRKVGANVETETGRIKLEYIHHPYHEKAERSIVYLPGLN